MPTTTNTVVTFPKSSSIAAILYGSGKLLIEFQGAGRELGNVYSYSHVPESVVEGFIATASPGRYFQSYVRGQYTSKRLW